MLCPYGCSMSTLIESSRKEMRVYFFQRVYAWSGQGEKGECIGSMSGAVRSERAELAVAGADFTSDHSGQLLRALPQLAIR